MRITRITRKTLCLLVLALMGCPLGLFAQVRTISGTVTDETGEPMVGVAVLVQGTSNGTITNVDGKFTLDNVTPSSTLEVSFVGYLTKEVKVGNLRTMAISMQLDNQMLEEVVVVGYGTVKKSDLTGAISSISGDQIKERSNANAMSLLSGKVAGVQIQQTQGAPGYSPVVKIRGVATITSGNTPLYVIDGVPIEDADMSMINAQDIASIEVMKDASSAAIYGSRGANGVVMITTKSGKPGKTVVDASYELGIQKVTRYVDMMDSQQFIQYYVDAHNNSGDTTIPEEFLTSPESFETTDWQKVLFRTALSHNAQLSVSGGNDKTQFRMSGSYLSQNGVVDRSYYKRLNIRSNVTHQIMPNLKIGMNLALARIDTRMYGTEGKADVVSLAQQNDPIFPVYNENGNYGYRDPDSEWYRFMGYGLQLWHPYALTREVDKSDITMNLFASVFLEYKFLKDFTAKTTFSLTNDDERYTDYQNEGQKYGYSNENPATANDNTYRTFNWLSETTLSYNKEINKHSIGVLVGFSAQKEQYNESTMTAQDFPNDMVHTINAGTVTSASSSMEEWSLMSYYGRINYSYNDRYLLTATIRRDGSSRFGANNRWGTFPSASVAWKFSEEEFMKNLKWISSAKLRVSYGVTGNNQIDNYGSIGLLSQNYYLYGSTNTAGLYTSTISNPDLKWEKTQQFDVGLNISFLKNRIYVEADYYHSTTKDMLLDVPVPAITGFTEQLTNIGKMRNTGFEFLITSKNFVRAFTWETSFNISVNRNKVLELGSDGSPIYTSNWGTTKTEIGQPIANYYGYILDGVFMSDEEIANYAHHSSTTVGDPKIRDVNGDGEIDEDDRAIIGNVLPDFTFGLTNTFTYKNFDLEIVIQGSYGNEIMNSSARYLGVYNGSRNGYASAANYWRSTSEPGDGKHFKPYTSYPGLQNEFSTYWVEDGSYLRIANIRLGYTFSKKQLRKTPFTSARIYCNLDNVAVFTNYKNGYDPENSVFTDALNTGNDYGSYPLPLTVAIGVKFSL